MAHWHFWHELSVELKRAAITIMGQGHHPCEYSDEAWRKVAKHAARARDAVTRFYPDLHARLPPCPTTGQQRVLIHEFNQWQDLEHASLSL